jgi:hypothetical protein|tara:strand:- start:46090 stop:46323 length:234 start_codon:yes stop_codon:yes gene_type:complete
LNRFKLSRAIGHEAEAVLEVRQAVQHTPKGGDRTSGTESEHSLLKKMDTLGGTAGRATDILDPATYDTGSALTDDNV